MRTGIFFISLGIMVALGFVLNWLFFAFDPLGGGEINWFAGILGLGVIAGLLIVGIVFIVKFHKKL